jgi:Saxitoxin biosynthesis operon protein SxtJ
MLKPVWCPDPKQLRQFAIAGLVVFGVIGAVSYLSGSTRAAINLWGIGVLTLLLGVLVPSAMRLPYVLLMAAAYPIGWLVSHLVLRLIFYGVFTPVGLIFRFVRRDALALRRPQTESYWRELRRSDDVTSYYRQA